MSKAPLPISTAEYVQRREGVLKILKDSVGVVFAGEGVGGIHGKWRANPFFIYLTGIDDEPDAAVVFDPQSESDRTRTILFLRPLAPETEAWDGLRDSIAQPLRDRLGFRTIRRTSHLPMILSALGRKRRKLSCLHPPAAYTANVTPDLAIFRKISERTLGVSIDDKSAGLLKMRAAKSKGEVALMQHAINITGESLSVMARAIKPGSGERDLMLTLEHGFKARGADGPAYETIVGSGVRGTVLHYTSNSQPLEAGDLIVVDAGARFAGYAADITRTYPVSGRFTPEQREMYELVLRAQAASIRACKPGVFISDVDEAARVVFERAGVGDAFIHGIGHHLGIEVHDATPDAPLEAGNVVTIEPGVYFPDRKMGIRIEDDILITASGNKNLSQDIPKAADEVEALIGGKPGPRARSRSA